MPSAPRGRRSFQQSNSADNPPQQPSQPTADALRGVRFLLANKLAIKILLEQVFLWVNGRPILHGKLENDPWVKIQNRITFYENRCGEKQIAA